MKKQLAIIILFISSFGYTQQGTMEIGSDISFWASNMGGSVNVAPRFGYEVIDDLSVGPSLRFINHWSDYYGVKNSFNIWGFGAFAHYRFIDWLYAGIDIETYFTPYNYKINATKYRAVSPAIILSAGMSRKIGDHFRINAGINFDVLNDVNSPMRPSYIAKTSKGVRIPLFYRVTFLYVF